MKKYEAYKNSGIEWIGQIPKDWEVIKIKNLCNVTDGTHFSPRTESTGKPYVTVSNVNNDFVDVANALLISEEDFDTLVRQGCQPKVGDVLLSKDGTVGRSAIVGNNNGFVCLSSLGILSPKAGLFSGYLKRSLDSIMLQYQMNRAMAGSALKRITISKINEFCMLLPPLSEQKAIAFYLDYKAGQIDASISAINTQIDDLKSYRQSIISEAVTKGLNPNVPMKDSGVDWIGEIPEGWSLSRIKFETDMVLGKMLEYKEPKNNNGSYTLEPYLKSRNIGMLKVFNDIEQLDRMWFNDKEKTQYELKDGDLVMNEGGDIGKVSLWKDPGFKCYIQNSVHKITPHRDVLDSTYLQYLVSIITSKGYFNTVVSSISIAHLTKEKLAETPILLPPLSEQQTIASYLDSKTSKIDATIASLESQRDDLNALKQSIISEAVTGKIDVRDWKPNK